MLLLTAFTIGGSSWIMNHLFRGIAVPAPIGWGCLLCTMRRFIPYIQLVKLLVVLHYIIRGVLFAIYGDGSLSVT